jgi:arylsulfatase A-like enzyme
MSPARQGKVLGDLLAVALWFGMAGGLIEGACHLVVQRLGFLENVWYQIVWIPAVFNALVLSVLGLLLAVGMSFFPLRPRVHLSAIFVLAFAACLPWVALILKEWVHPFAILILTGGIATAVARWCAGDEWACFLFFRRSLPWVGGLTLVLFVGIQGGIWLRERVGTAKLPPAAASAPDILVVVIDALRADHLSIYGYGRQTSPGLDKLAAGGVLFEQAYSTSSYTLPSHASILTGLYPSQHGVEWGTARVQATASYPTLAEALQSHGYRTGAFSGNTFWFTRAQGFGRGFLHFDDFFSSLADVVLRTAYGRITTLTMQRLRLGSEDIPARKRAPDTNRAVLNWVHRDVGRPFFTVINYMDVHDPYLPPVPFRSKFSNESNPGGLLNWELHVPQNLTPTQLQGEIDAYDGSIAFVDSQIDGLIASLQWGDRARDLLVVITSDHGEEFGEHGGFLHARHLYREVIHVPLIVWWPGRVPAGKRVSQPVTNAAIPSSIMNLLDVGDRTFPGPPLERLWEAAEAPSTFPLPSAELKQRPWAPRGDLVREGSMRSIVGPVWHYLEHDTRGRELYNWVNDPRESVDLSKDPKMQAVIEDFGRQMVKRRSTRWARRGQ